MVEAENNIGYVKIVWMQGLAVFCEHVIKATKFCIFMKFVCIVNTTAMHDTADR
jgi:hypothetical protein